MLSKRKRRDWRGFVGSIAHAVIWGSHAYGMVYAIRTFFTFELCRGPQNCYWPLDGFSPIIIGAIFLCAFLPISWVFMVLAAWPGYILAAVLFWVSGATPPWANLVSRFRRK